MGSDGESDRESDAGALRGAGIRYAKEQDET